MWPAAIQQHLDAGLPMTHQWALFGQAKEFGTNTIVPKGLWTGDYDYTITLDNVSRTYEGAMGGILVAPIRYRVGTIIMSQDVDIALSDEGQSLVRGYNLRNAPCDVFCLCFNALNGAYLGARRFVKGTIDGSSIKEGPQGETSRMTLRIVSVARKGTMTQAGKKSDASQKMRNALDDFRKYSDLGRVSSDTWGAEPDD